MSKKSRGYARWQQYVSEQLEWIAKCGGDLAGYVTNYSKYGRSQADAEAIYNADVAELRRREEMFAYHAAKG